MAQSGNWGQTLYSAVWGLTLFVLAGCESTSLPGPRIFADATKPATPEQQFNLLNRVTWGANPSSAREIVATGYDRYLEQQLRPAAKPALPADVQRQIDAMTINRPLDQLIFDLEMQRRATDAIKEPEEK